MPAILGLMLLASLVNAGNAPIQTTYELDGPDNWGWTPKPTSAPERRKRQTDRPPSTEEHAGDPAVCGYFTDPGGNASQTLKWDCGANESVYAYCAYDTALSAFGCATETADSSTKYGIATTCVESPQKCDASCSSDPYGIYCNSTDTPHCVKFINNAHGYELTGWECGPTYANSITMQSTAVSLQQRQSSSINITVEASLQEVTVPVTVSNESVVSMTHPSYTVYTTGLMADQTTAASSSSPSSSGGERGVVVPLGLLSSISIVYAIIGALTR